MKQCKKWSVALISVSMMGVLSGCSRTKVVHSTPTTNHTVTNTAIAPANNTSSTGNQTAVQLPTKPVSSTDTSTIELLKQQTHFKAVLPSSLPKGYGENYSAELDNFPKNHKPNRQALNLLFKKTNNQYFKVIEFPDPNAQNSTPSNNFKRFTIDGTEVDVFSPSSNGVLQQYHFVKNGMLFQVISFGNSHNDTKQFVKSIINGGTPWN